MRPVIAAWRGYLTPSRTQHRKPSKREVGTLFYLGPVYFAFFRFAAQNAFIRSACALRRAALWRLRFGAETSGVAAMATHWQISRSVLLRVVAEPEGRHGLLHWPFE